MRACSSLLIELLFLRHQRVQLLPLAGVIGGELIVQLLQLDFGLGDLVFQLGQAALSSSPGLRSAAFCFSAAFGRRAPASGRRRWLGGAFAPAFAFGLAFSVYRVFAFVRGALFHSE